MKTGKCHLCGRIGELSYEHVPPKKAFNSHKQFIYLGDKIVEQIQSKNYPWDFKNFKGKQLQRGIGFYTLCPRCNNDAGTLYGQAFIDFIYQGYQELINNPEHKGKEIIIKFKGIYPLRIIKQITTMFFSINNENFSDKRTDLRDFVLLKNKKMKFQNIAFYIYLNKGAVLRYLGITPKYNGVTKSIRTISELSIPPFGVVLEINSKEEGKLLDVSHFTYKFDYNDLVDIELRLPILETNTMYPLDYRTKSDIIKNRKK